MVVLWVTTAVATISLAAVLIARQEIGAATNRAAIIEATWRAEGCVETMIIGLQTALWADAPDTPTLQARWNELRTLVRHAIVVPPGCSASARADGATRNINALSSDQLIRLLLSAGVSHRSAFAVVAAILDWRDDDTIARPGGAESAWYADRLLAHPRNGDVRASEEMLLIRGLAEIRGIDTLLGVDRPPVVWSQAPLPVLASLPGMSVEAASIVEQHRRRGQPIVDPTALLPLLAGEARDSLETHAAELLSMTTAIPESWTLRAIAHGQRTPVDAILDVRVALGNDRLAVLERTRRP